MEFDKISMINVSRCKYKNEYYVTKHRHNFYHFIYVTGDHGQMIINNNERYDAQEDDIYLIHPGIDHEFKASPQSTFCTIEVKFRVHDHNLKEMIDRLPSKLNNMDKGLRLLLESILQEASLKELLFKEIITTNYAQFLYYMLRLNQSGSSHAFAPQSYKGSVTFENDSILAFIQENYQKKISLHDLSKAFAMNQSQLCRIFSIRFGISPIQYVNNYRISKVKELLIYTNLTITRISEEVGFQSVQYLCRYFTKREGISPLQFRQNRDESVYFVVE